MKSERKYSFLEAKSRLESLCAYQERCSFELKKKMNTWYIDVEDQDILLADLISNNFLNEERFAEAYVSGKTKIKRWGRVKIRIELQRRFVSEYSIKKGLKSVDPDLYWNALVQLAERKWVALSGESNDYKRKMKTYRFLATKGYETDLIKDAVELVISQQ